MIIEEQHTKQIVLVDEEVDVFNDLLEKLLKKTNTIGFKKEFSLKEVKLIKELIGEEIEDE